MHIAMLLGWTRLPNIKNTGFAAPSSVVLNLALTGMVILVVTQNQTYRYPGNLIYAMGAYAFYSVITAVRNVVKFRKQNSPVLSAAKGINLASALVSMLALKLQCFPSLKRRVTRVPARDEFRYRRAVCCVVLGMAVYDGSRNTKPEEAGTAARSRRALWYNIKTRAGQAFPF